MYPIETFDWWQVLLGVLAFFVTTVFVWFKDGQPSVFGLSALPISLATSWVWFDKLDEWTAWAVLGTTFALFLIGMLWPDGKGDEWWHFGAILTALFGKLTIWLATVIWPWIVAFLQGEVTIPNWVLIVPVVLVALCIVIWFVRHRLKSLSNLSIRLKSAAQPAPANTSTT